MIELLGLLFIISIFVGLYLFLTSRHRAIVDVEPDFEIMGEQYNETIGTVLDDTEYLQTMENAKYRSIL